MGVGVERQSGRNGRSVVEEHDIQRRSILLMIDRHLKVLQTEGKVASIAINLNVKRGGNIDPVAQIEYVGKYKFPENWEESPA